MTTLLIASMDADFVIAVSASLFVVLPEFATQIVQFGVSWLPLLLLPITTYRLNVLVRNRIEIAPE